MADHSTLAQRLLDAQVAWHLDLLSGPGVGDRVEADVDDLLRLGADIRIDSLITADAVKELARVLLEAVPPSTAASTFVAGAADIAYAGPTEPFALAEVIDREHVERLVDEALGMTGLTERFLDRLTESPLVAALASRFVGRVVNDVVAMNQAVADKIPGVGSLMSLGTSAAGKVLGAADKSLQQVLGDTAGKSTVFVMKRLNKVVIETLKDPSTRDAVLEVFDLYADQPLPGPETVVDREDLHRLAGLIQDIVISGAATPPTLALVDALVDGFFATYGEHPVPVLLTDLGLGREDLVAQARTIVPGILDAAAANGELERLIRARLEPFYASAEVAAILAD